MGLQTAEKPETELPTSIGAQRKKNIYFCFTDYTKVVDSVDQTNWKILKEMGVPDHLICLLRNPYADQEATVRTGQGIMDWFQIWKGAHVKAAYCHSAYLTYMQSTSCRAQAGINIAGRNINNPRYAEDTTLMAGREEELRRAS